MFWLHFTIVDADHHYSVKDRGWVDRNLGRAAFFVDLAKGPAEVLSPLKAVLESISGVYAQYQVKF